MLRVWDCLLMTLVGVWVHLYGELVCFVCLEFVILDFVGCVFWFGAVIWWYLIVLLIVFVRSVDALCLLVLC